MIGDTEEAQWLCYTVEGFVGKIMYVNLHGQHQIVREQRFFIYWDGDVSGKIATALK